MVRRINESYYKRLDMSTVEKLDDIFASCQTYEDFADIAKDEGFSDGEIITYLYRNQGADYDEAECALGMCYEQVCESLSAAANKNMKVLEEIRNKVVEATKNEYHVNEPDIWKCKYSSNDECVYFHVVPVSGKYFDVYMFDDEPDKVRIENVGAFAIKDAADKVIELAKNKSKKNESKVRSRKRNRFLEAPKYPRGIRKEDSYRQYGLYYEDVARFFKRKGYDISNDEVFNYISGVVDLMDYDPDLGSGEVLPSEWLSDWYRDTKMNYPEDIEWLESTRK